MSLRPAAERLSSLLGAPVPLAADCVGPEVAGKCAALAPGQALMLENLRFHPEEEANDQAFARELAPLADIFVNDAFGAAHRAHASTAGVAAFLPAVAGLLMEAELKYLGAALDNPRRPLGFVVGGAKVSGKIDVLKNMVGRADVVCVGGGMANTFLLAQGLQVGASLVEEGQTATARSILEAAAARGSRFLLPVDVVVAEDIQPGAATRVVEVTQVPDGSKIADIGPRSVEAFSDALSACKTVVWNGPMGVFEVEEFAAGSEGVARAIAGLDATTIVGGGETAQLVADLGLTDAFTHVSTGGGASLEFLEGKVLPGVAVLLDA
jgi:phosphoglycerate kinase